MKCTRNDWIGLTITYAILLLFLGKRQTYVILDDDTEKVSEPHDICTLEVVLTQ